MGCFLGINGSHFPNFYGRLMMPVEMYGTCNIVTNQKSTLIIFCTAYKEISSGPV